MKYIKPSGNPNTNSLCAFAGILTVVGFISSLVFNNGRISSIAFISPSNGTPRVLFPVNF